MAKVKIQWITRKKISDNSSEPINKNLSPEFLAQNNTKVNDSSKNEKAGNFLSDNIVRSNLLSGAIAENTLSGSDLIMDDSGNNPLLASNQGNVSDAIMNSAFQASNKNDWKFSAFFYLWLVGINGTAAVKGRETDVHVNFGDIWEDLDVGIQGYFEVQKNKWGGFFDGTWMRLKPSGSVTGPLERVEIKTNSEMNFALFELGGFYEVGHWPFAKGAPKITNPEAPSVRLDVLAGGRLWYLDSEINFRQAPPIFPGSVSGDKTWFDFIVGSRAFLYATENLKLWLRTDIGGFGFGFSSDFSWNLISGIMYEFPYGINLGLAYRLMYEKYEDGSGNDRFLFDVWMYGPVVSLGIVF